MGLRTPENMHSLRNLRGLRLFLRLKTIFSFLKGRGNDLFGFRKGGRGRTFLGLKNTANPAPLLEYTILY